MACTAWLSSAAALAQDAAAKTAAKPAAGAATEAADTGVSRDAVINVMIVLAIFILPMIIGSWLGKRLRMPDHGWKFAVAIGTLAAAAVVIARGEIKLGPDLSGGITLIYELDPSAVEDQLAQNSSEQGGPNYTADQIEQNLVEMLVTSLSQRVDPSGTKEVSIRSYGPGQIEIIIPRASQEELESIEKSIYTAGALEFRIVASRNFARHRSIIELAEALPKGNNIVRLDDGTEVARWVSYRADEFENSDGTLNDNTLVRREGARGKQLLILTNDGQNVTGDAHVKSTYAGADQLGKPAVHFSMNAAGSIAFGELTGNNLPTASGQKYRLGILLDKELLSAPNINSRISSQGIIEGNMGAKEVKFIVDVIQAGSLPAALNKDPISKEQISPTIGKLTIEQGKLAIGVSLIAVLIFMVLYYRFAGVVACIALAANLLLILGCMVLIKGAFTLPGLAGLVLTVGMSVDANVLIFERIREELERGAALRMAIRNGFARAMSTIVDANVTTLITAIVIYKIAPDNVKGFGVTLILGILMSLYCAIFLSRLIFDVAEKTGFMKKLSMARVIGHTHVDFLGGQKIAIAASLLMICIGIAGLVLRGNDIFNIDFTGGSSVTMVLNDAMPYADVKQTIEDKTDLDEKNLTLVEVGDTGTRYTVTSVEENVNDVEETLGKTFGDKLKTYRVEVKDLKTVGDDEQASVGPARSSAAALWPANPLAWVTLLQAPDAEIETDSEAIIADAETESAPDEDATESVEELTVETESPAPADDQPASDEADGAPAAAEDSDGKPPESAFVGGTTAQLTFDLGEGDEDEEGSDGVNYSTLESMLKDSLAAHNASGAAYRLESTDPGYVDGSRRSFKNWEATVALPLEQAQGVFDSLQTKINSQPMFPLASKIGSKVAGRLGRDAIAAIVISLVGIIGYVWFRFNGVIYGLAAVLALVHDVIITLG
ncbi:MAG: protein translocase subunit SecD, partial [Planctomycetales bacterium]|nr:protein translocase subunit SecD [Planctomycetales bacterium]